jgi:long-subunit acyl-CoA synthetase (AMP-forming)
LTNGFSDFEHLHRLYIMDREFSVETGEMTPTMKVKRHMIKTMFSNVHHASHFGKE